MTQTLKPYMCYDARIGAFEAACLVFAHTADEARTLAYTTLTDWGMESITDARAELMLDAPWILAEGDQQKLADGIPHIIECPTTCPRCEKWGGQILNVGCSLCRNLNVGCSL